MASEAELTNIILSQLERIETNQEKLSDQLSRLDVRLSVMERDVKNLYYRVDGINGCAGDMESEIATLQSAVERLDSKRWSRSDKLRVWMPIVGMLVTIGLFIFSLVLK